MHDVDAVVIGGGVVGLAIGRRLSAVGLETIVIEANASFGSETSARNSEVIHAGLYYAPGSLKARLCRSGRDRLYRYCADRAISHRRIGKLIFAREADEDAVLDAINARAEAIGTDDLVRLSRAEAQRLEPKLDCCAALLSPSTGIIDSHAFMTSLVADLEGHGGRLVCRTRLTSAHLLDSGGWAIGIEQEKEPVLRARLLVNAAGLWAHDVAESIDGFPTASLPSLRLARGVYYACSKRLPFSHLIYPVPTDGGLGIHLTLDLAGQARFGPNVEWVDTVHYNLMPEADRDALFLAAARSIHPAIDAAHLTMSFSGIRPKLSGPGEPPADFLLVGPSDHGLPNHVGLFGIESPGLTASLALADEVAARLGVAEEGA